MSENPAGTLSQRARHRNTRRTKSPSVEASRPGTHTPELGGQVIVTHVRLNGPLHYASVNTPDPHCKGILGSATDFCLYFIQSKSGWFDAIYGARESATYNSSKVFERF